MVNNRRPAVEANTLIAPAGELDASQASWGTAEQQLPTRSHHISGGNMAIDVYLQIDGIKGESTDAKHQGWIECLSVNWAISQPKSATASTGGGHTAERCELTEISFSKIADLASPILSQTCAGGKAIANAKFEFMRADSQNEAIKYYEIELENVLIAHVAPAISEGSILSENVGLKFSKVRWKYTKQNVGGGTSGNTTGGWDLAKNRYV